MPAEPKSEIGENFRKQLEALAVYATQQATAATSAEAPKWYRPDGLEDDLRDSAAIHEAFSREAHEQDFEKAVVDPQSPGTCGDLAMSQLQGDTLAVMERAFRTRHQSALRSRLHAAARLKGHGHDYGVIRGGLLQYIVNLDRRNKG